MKLRYLIGVAALPLMLAACGDSPEPTETERAERQVSDNPLLSESGLPYNAPPFDRIEAEHFGPALEKGMEEHMAEIEAIANNPEPPSFENTIVAMERSGQTLSSVSRVFFALAGSHTNEDIQATQREMAPKLSAHSDAINLNPELFSRVDALYQQRDELDLDPESHRLLERYHRDFVRSGARLSEEQQARLREINSRLAELGTQFSQNVLAEVNDSAVVVDSREELDGLSDAQIERAANEAKDRGLDGKYVITLLNTSGQPPLSSLTNREVRERVHTASLDRGARGNEYDTRGIVSETLTLRAERANMLGYANHAEFILEEQTAGSVDVVNELLADLNPIAMRNAREEAADIQAIINATEDEPLELASWDWAFYAEKVRQERYAFDNSEVRPYFEFDSVMENGVFYSAEKLFGITFEERHDIPVYHDSVRVYEVFEEDGTPLGLMYSDMYSRGSKRGGAWMNSYQIQSDLLGGQPVVGIHLNVSQPPEGEPTLLTWDETTTLFHEFGHAIHGLFSDVHYPRFSGTSVPRDFVEYPSQVYEMWASWPEVLANYALHYETGERIPDELLEKVLDAQQFNQGFRTTEYLAASTIDQRLHQLPIDEIPAAEDIMDFEAQVLAESGMDFDPVPPRYRTPYFSHIMGGYSAGYYSYIWSEVLDADSVLWFKENDGLTRENGQHFRDTLLSRGGTADAMDLYMDFAGRQPEIEALLIRRGLIDDE
ncbi:M3 family metallopeptidase [Natronospira bacteriovora]|uniref:M3 family metallopeptidase n=1 Tax=Natronospira bacteriovora TaxID=3069753 RepID=A0ABU0W6X3_9GAMM|nr:M3 family metallopeptidase [Natronospira sp. AB-CW4]MDQ2069785.1 M3 family metallopeptidase [Natronospira sp. AB-CW4]